MEDQVVLGVVAVAAGVVASIFLFVPFVALTYRKRGRLTPGRFLLWFAALVYFWAIWTYTLLPLPDPDSIRCVGAVLDPMQLVRDVREAAAADGRFIADPAIQQILLNVLLFIPLGFFVRVLGGRGLVVAFLVGGSLSLLVETTQLTGVWGIYPCAYRLFDVGDLITNTSGALVGSVLGTIVPQHLRGSSHRDPEEPGPVTRTRRALGMLCDALAFTLINTGIAVGVQLWLRYVSHSESAVADGGLASWVGILATSGLWLILILATGRSVGDLSVQLRYWGGPLPRPAAHFLRWAGGISGIALLGQVAPPSFPPASGSVLVLISIVLLFGTEGGRGLPGLISGQRLIDARERIGSWADGCAANPAARTERETPGTGLDDK